MVSRASPTLRPYLIDFPQAPSRPPPPPSRPLKSILKKTTNGGSQNAAAKPDMLFPSSKKDKRRIKHNQLLHKVTKSAERKPKRRRPNKKLVTTLDGLADALPDTEIASNDPTAAQMTDAGDKAQDQFNIIKRKSMKSRPGAMKRRENVDKAERDRFVKNMAQLSAAKPATGAVGKESLTDSGSTSTKATIPSTSERLAALRGFIFQTLETRPQAQPLKA